MIGATLAVAANLTFGVTFTNHVGIPGQPDGEDFNEVHPFIGVETETPVEGLTLGGRVFVNSFGDPAVLVGGDYRFPEADWGFGLGAAFGYEDIPVLPFARVTYHLHDHVSFSVSPIAADKAMEDLGLLFSLEIKY